MSTPEKMTGTEQLALIALARLPRVKILSSPVAHNPCPADKHTQREYMKTLLKKIQEDIPFAKDRITAAVMHPERYNLWDKAEENFIADKSYGEPD